jgi:hypothetical protein
MVSSSFKISVRICPYVIFLSSFLEFSQFEICRHRRQPVESQHREPVVPNLAPGNAAPGSARKKSSTMITTMLVRFRSVFFLTLWDLHLLLVKQILWWRGSKNVPCTFWLIWISWWVTRVKRNQKGGVAKSDWLWIYGNSCTTSFLLSSSSNV